MTSSQPPAPTSTQTPTAASTAGQAKPPDNTKAVLTLVLGILSLVCCGFISGIPAILVGKAELKAIDEGRGSEANRGMAKVGYILGIVGTILSCLGVLAYGAIIAFALLAGKQVPTTF